MTVNEILGDHNVDKQITDNKGDVRDCYVILKTLTDRVQVAYLMADISSVHTGQIKEISDSLEALSCKFDSPYEISNILILASPHHDTHSVLIDRIRDFFP